MRANQINALFFHCLCMVTGLWETVYALFYVRSTCLLQPVIRAENCDGDGDNERGNVEMMLIKISVIFYDYFYCTFLAFCARLPMNHTHEICPALRWPNECNKFVLDLISFNSPCDCLIGSFELVAFSAATVAEWHDSEDLRDSSWGLVKLKNCESNSPLFGPKLFVKVEAHELCHCLPWRKTFAIRGELFD